jgi:protein tyrosine phosphatase (PTP) superfamily phosphohydrolase (DUF442 family)
MFALLGANNPTSTIRPVRVRADHLPNLIQVTPAVYCGGLPAGNRAFQELKQLGIRTIISVDAAAPDLELARQVGLRYVHLPHGYDGISPQRGHELARAVRDLPRPIYIHCHHGKHRSPAAAAVACVEAGELPVDQSLTLLELAGTGRHYRGLFATVGRARPVDGAVLDAADSAFPPLSPVPPMAEMMVAAQETLDRLTRSEANGWRPSSDPAQDPAHQAVLLAEHYTETARLKESLHRPQAFRDLLTAGEKEAHLLEESLNHTRHEEASNRLSTLTNNCQACHQLFRDNSPKEPF